MTSGRSRIVEASVTEFPSADAQDNGRLHLATRVAWMYFVEGLRQDEIAASLGINRMRVNRLVALAREEGLVRVEITSPYRTACDLEARLRGAFGVREALVIQTPQDPALAVDQVGHALGTLLNERLCDGTTIGIHHGRSTHALLRGLKPASMLDLSIVSLKGNLSPLGRTLPHETVTRLALTLGASCYHLAAPSYARNMEEHALFMGLPMIQSVLERARGCAMAVLTASRVTDDGELVGNGFISARESAELRAAGAVGAILGAFVDADGRVVDHDVNHRRIGLDLDDLAAIPDVVLTGAGRGKVSALRAALRRGMVGTFVTDESTAASLLID